MVDSLLHSVRLGPWDLALVVVIALQATMIAYLYHPKWKAFILSLPIPFTISSLALGHQVDATNVLGLAVLTLYTHGVRICYQRLRLPIFPSIVLSALGYCLIGWNLARVVPKTDVAFWWSCAGVMLLAVVLLSVFPHREEPGHREPMPLWMKLPMVTAIALFLVLAKNGLQGFMTVFPMVGVFASYEGRHSMWTLCRQIPILTLTLTPMMIASRMTEPHLGLGLSLAVGWVVMLAILLPMTYRMWQAET